MVDLKLNSHKRKFFDFFDNSRRKPIKVTVKSTKSYYGNRMVDVVDSTNIAEK